MQDMTIPETITALKVIRTALCAYRSPHGRKCDCKYGVRHVAGLKVPQLPSGENGSGCPEIYQAIKYLEDLLKLQK